MTDTIYHYHWCHDCRGWEVSNRDIHGRYTCDVCGSDILCDECGQRWTDDHPDHVQGDRHETTIRDLFVDEPHITKRSV